MTTNPKQTATRLIKQAIGECLMMEQRGDRARQHLHSALIALELE